MGFASWGCLFESEALLMEIIGKKIICDRCGEETFVKKIDTKETDGGYTKYDVYEELPKGWKSRMEPGYMLMCPSCNQEFDNLLKDFMKEE